MRELENVGVVMNDKEDGDRPEIRLFQDVLGVIEKHAEEQNGISPAVVMAIGLNLYAWAMVRASAFKTCNIEAHLDDMRAAMQQIIATQDKSLNADVEH